MRLFYYLDLRIIEIKNCAQAQEPCDARLFVCPNIFIMSEILPSNISDISTKAPCEAALMGERHVRIEISDFVMRTFVPIQRKDSSHAVFFLSVKCNNKLKIDN